jgi:hypothetical protein
LQMVHIINASIDLFSLLFLSYWTMKIKALSFKPFQYYIIR